MEPQQQLCCKFDACAATLDATGLGHLLGVDSASCSCECVVSSTWIPSSSWFDVVLWCDGSSIVLVPLAQCSRRRPTLCCAVLVRGRPWMVCVSRDEAVVGLSWFLL